MDTGDSGCEDAKWGVGGQSGEAGKWGSGGKFGAETR